MSTPKYRKGWYVSTVNNNIKGKIVDVIKTPSGYEYTININGTMGKRMTFHESQLIKEGNQYESSKR